MCCLHNETKKSSSSSSSSPGFVCFGWGVFLHYLGLNDLARDKKRKKDDERGKLLFRASSEIWIERERKKEATLVVVPTTGLKFGERERERVERGETRVCSCAIQIRNWG